MNLKSVDVSLVLYMMERASQPSSRKRYLWLSKSGDGWLSIIVLGSYIIYNAATLMFFAACSSVAIERSLYWAIKNTTRRRRPHKPSPVCAQLLLLTTSSASPQAIPLLHFCLLLL
ncbi:hypothetical protein [Microbulbifer sp. GL-2]|uniref:hypothetical protein n=1 Tax=Microbulbifer sp. GL-2 TaxID=2591606 RepID=UPI001E330C5F|nr:hypothetical protein [Microbulbifer sp. GL-2]